MIIDTLQKSNIDNLAFKHATDSLTNKIKELENSNINNDKAIKYINAIGAQWPFILIVLIAIVFFNYRKKIELFLSKTKTIKGAAAGLSVEIVQNESDQKSREHRIVNQTEEPEIDSSEKSQITTITTKREASLFDTYIALNKGELDEANKILDEIQSRSTEKDIEYNRIIFYYYKYQCGYIDALKDLILLRNSTKHVDVKLRADYFILKCYVFSSNYEKAIELGKSSIEIAGEEGMDESKLEIILVLSDAYNKSNQSNDYIKLLLKEIKMFSLDEHLFKLYKKIADSYNKIDMKVESSAFLLKATSYLSNDVDTLFDTAYRFSDINFDDMAVQFYELAYSLKRDHSSTINNLAVSYSKLGVKGKTMSLYEKAYELGNSLAASNLANNYINAGFLVQARDLLVEVKNRHEKIDPNIWKSFDELEKVSKEDKTKEEEISKRAILLKYFFEVYANSILEEQSSNLFLLSDYDLKDEENTVSTNSNIKSIEIDYEESILTIKFLTGESTFGTCQGIQNSKAGKPPKYDTYKGFYCFYKNELCILLKYDYYILRQEIRTFTFIPRAISIAEA